MIKKELMYVLNQDTTPFFKVLDLASLKDDINAKIHPNVFQIHTNTKLKAFTYVLADSEDEIDIRESLSIMEMDNEQSVNSIIKELIERCGDNE